MNSPSRDWVPHSDSPKSGMIPKWFKAFPEPLMLLDPKGLLIEVNTAAEVFLVGSSLLRGNSWSSHFPNAAEQASKILAIAEAKTIQCQEKILVRLDQPVYVHLTLSPYQHRNQWVWLAVLKDISSFLAENQSLSERLRLETIITSLSTHFINITSERIDSGIQYALRVLGEWIGADRCSMLLFSPDRETMARNHIWCHKSFEKKDLPTHVPLAPMPWLKSQMHQIRIINLPNASHLPPEAITEKQSWEKRGAISMLGVPLIYRGESVGYLILETLFQEKNWTDNQIAALRMSGELLVNALERKKADLALQESEKKYLGIFENAIEGLYQTTPDGQWLSVNPSLANLLGYSHVSEMMANPPDLLQHFYHLPNRRQEFVAAFKKNGAVRDFESQVRRRDHSLIWITESVRAVLDDQGQIQRFEGMMVDITQRKAMEDRIIFDALHDALTGLPNRVLFQDQIGKALEQITPQSGALCAVLLLDLDRFKRINDSMGHTRGDLLLTELARRFSRLLPKSSTLARLGGDEFGFLLEKIKDVSEAIKLADHLLKEMLEPVFFDGQELYTSGSIGIALGSYKHQDPEGLLRDADTALDRAKGNGKARYAVFDHSMHTKAVHLLRLETDLRNALGRREFLLHYQPIVNLKNRSLIGFEALVRWQPTSSKKLIPPNDFIPIAEETGLIIPLGKWVFEEAARQLSLWRKLFPMDPPLTMSVNVSGRQIEDARLVGNFRQVCANVGLPHNAFKLEITESALMGNPELAAEVLQELYADGFKLSLDDFGTGYSSLSYLHRFPFQTLKIDRSFVARLQKGNKEDEIIKVISAMAVTMGMDVIAEGIESQEQMSHILRHGVSFGQGYYFSKPMGFEKCESLLTDPENLWATIPNNS